MKCINAALASSPGEGRRVLRGIGDGANFETHAGFGLQRTDHAKQIPRIWIFVCELKSRYGNAIKPQ